MKKGLLVSFFLLLMVFAGSSFGQGITDEYGTQNFNAYLGGLGLTVSYANINHHTDFNLDTAGTLEAWVYPTTVTGATRCIVSKGASSTVSFLFGINGTTGRLYFRIGGTDFYNTDGAAVPLNVWSHVAVSWSGGPSYGVTFCLNGAQTGSVVYSSGPFYANNDPLRIGGSQAFPSYVFIGNIDEVRLWKRSKTPAQIAANRFIGLGDGDNANSWNALTGGKYYDGLVSSWTFNTSGTVITDYIGYHTGNYVGSAASTQTVLGVPVPYNFALKLGGGQYDYVSIPTNTAFNQTSDGTIEMWFKPLSVTNEQVLMSKGSTFSTLSFMLGVAPGGKLYFGTGTNTALNSTGTALTVNQWNHIAVTWATVGSTFDVRFYKNGVQNGSASTIPNSFPVNTDACIIGNSGIYNLPANGFIDEIRLWNPARTADQIKQYMFVSARSFSTLTGLLAFWNFDGNLKNLGSTAGIDASLNNGQVNNTRLSGYTNDSVSGAYGTGFISHSTAINRTGTSNPFPLNYYMRYPFLAIPDNYVPGVKDSITVTGLPGTVVSVELFLSVQHTYIGDLTFILRAPNGSTRTIISGNGGAGKNILSFFADDFQNLLSDVSYLPPWGYIKPSASFGSFGGTTANGNWMLWCVDNIANDVGILQGWGLKFNVVTGVSGENTVPEKYSLSQNYPNPFNPVTSIKFDVKKNGFVSLKIYNTAGIEVKTLVSENMNAGNYEVTWDASSFSSGTYFLKMEAGEFREVKKMILVK